MQMKACDCRSEDVACDHDGGFRGCGHCHLCGHRVWWNECDLRGEPRFVANPYRPNPKANEWVNEP